METNNANVSLAKTDKSQMHCCCGSTDHHSPECPDKHKHKHDWFVNEVTDACQNKATEAASHSDDKQQERAVQWNDPTEELLKMDVA